MIIYLVVLPEDQPFFTRQDFHLIQNKFHDKKAAIDFLNQNKNKFPTAKIVTAELSPESNQHRKIYGNRITFPTRSVIAIDENPNLEKSELDFAELVRKMNLGNAFNLAQAATITNPAADNRREIFQRNDIQESPPDCPILDRAAALDPNERRALLHAALARLVLQAPINRVPPAAASPSPVPNENRGAILRAGVVAQFPVQPARGQGLGNTLAELKSVLSRYLQRYIDGHPSGEERRKIAERAQQHLKTMNNDINAEAFKKFLVDTKREIEKTPDHKASGLWRLFEEIIKKVDLLSLAATPSNPNLVTERFPFINLSQLEMAKALDLVCPISGSIMDDPIKVLPSGKYYNRSSIDQLKASGAAFICSITRQPITSVVEVPEKKKEIEVFLKSARSGNQQNSEALIPPTASPPSGPRLK